MTELRLYKGSSLGRCYRVRAFLGRGGFGVVARCCNTNNGREEAIKVSRNCPKTFRQAREEIAMLKHLWCLNSEACNIVRWNGFFFEKHHVCLNFELLDQSLCDYVDERDHHLPIKEVSPIIYQLATALSHLKSLGLVHADLKPENVMIVDRNQQPLRVKLIDFGLAHHVSDAGDHFYVQTMSYKAPEIILQIPHNEAIDMWTVGLIAAELVFGYQLFYGESEYDVLCHILQCQGQLADDLLDCGRATSNYFYRQRDARQLWRFKTPAEYESDTGIPYTDKRIICLHSLDDIENVMVVDNGYQNGQDFFMDLIKQMLLLNADKRIKPMGVLQHPLFSLDFGTPKLGIGDFEPVTGQQPSTCLTGPSKTFARKSAAAENSATLETDDQGQVDVHPESNTERDGWFSGFLGKMTKAFCHLWWRGRNFKADRASSSLSHTPTDQ